MRNLKLLEEVKRKYPIGTIFKIAHKPSVTRTVKNHTDHKNTFLGEHINLMIEEESEDGCISASVYADGVWAEIIYKPTIEVW